MKTSRSIQKDSKQGVRSNRLPVSVSGAITLLTDFGTSDYFVGAVKGVILAVNPAAAVIDITHEIPPQDIEGAAFTLLACYESFPIGTIHVAVVDPGVGSARRAILVRAGQHFFVGPDNGVFSYVLDREPDHTIIHITSRKYFRQPPSTTFHGRDVFAPVAAALSRGISFDSFGRPIDDEVRLEPLTPRNEENGILKGRIIHIDHFGNCVTNFHRAVFNKRQEATLKLEMKGRTIHSIFRSYSEAVSDKPFAIWGSAGFLEISARNRSAAKILKAKRGDTITLGIS